MKLVLCSASRTAFLTKPSLIPVRARTSPFGAVRNIALGAAVSSPTHAIVTAD